MTKYEYQMIEIAIPSDIIQILNGYGDTGWQVVAMNPGQESYFFYMAREKHWD